MKVITTDFVITSIRSKVDHSLGLTGSTPELKNDEKVAFMELQGQRVKILIQPVDEPNAPEIKIDKEISNKTLSQILRGVFYVIFQRQIAEGKFSGSFDDYYRGEMNKIILHYKDKLDE